VGSASRQKSIFVMAGLVPAIHDFDFLPEILRNSWMPGTRPGMTG
jgi:hypothetical protein